LGIKKNMGRSGLPNPQGGCSESHRAKLKYLCGFGVPGATRGTEGKREERRREKWTEMQEKSHLMKSTRKKTGGEHT